MKNSLILILILFLTQGCIGTWKRTKKSPPPQHISKEEFKNMVSTGIPESRIERMLVKNPRGFYLTAPEILELRKWKASNRLIQVAMHPQRYKNQALPPKKKNLKPTSSKGQAEVEPKPSIKPSKKPLNPEKTKKAPAEEVKPKRTNRKRKHPSLYYYEYGKDEEDDEDLPPPQK